MDAYRNTADFHQLSSIGLTAKQIVRIDNPRGMTLRVESGEIWVTQERCREDFLMKTGEALTLKGGAALVSTLKAPFALVTIEPGVPAKHTLAERLARFWTALYAPDSRPTTAAL
ncbi:MAG TPA: DUF2917 domain-containing protein [Burkholderiales bacterium]|nr:DUF2917 domain-containing protein [Burkholderiales bacterium]